MIKQLAFLVASTLALSSTVCFADGTLKLEDLTKEQRTEMRTRADQLTADRAATASKTKAPAQHAPRMKKSHAT